MVKRKYIRTVVAYRDYFKDFKKTVSQKVIDKFYEVLKITTIMDKEEMERLNLTPIEDYITEDHGAEGTPSRMEFESDVDAFILGEQLKAERKKAGLTQEQLADKIGTKKSYISRVENGHTDIQLSTLFKIFQGLGRKVSLTVM
jgi:ribosome-binding protein aMBF1 (putative translation factor)